MKVWLMAMFGNLLILTARDAERLMWEWPWPSVFSIAGAFVVFKAGMWAKEHTIAANKEKAQ